MALFNQSRGRIIQLIFVGIFLIMLIQLFNLQILSGKYRQLAMDNAVFAKVRYPDRGIIFDRNGKAILDNTILYDLVVTPSELKNADTFGLCRLLAIDTAQFRKRVNDAIIKNGRYRPSVFQSLLTPELHARLEENIWKYNGFALVERPVRKYPYNAGAHVMGYIGEVDQNIIKKSNNYYRMGDFVGRSGLEASYETVLMGQRGVEYMIKDNHNRLVGSYENGLRDTLPIAGNNLHTYLDIELQQMAEAMMANKVGAVVAIDPRTGGILAMASGPNYDPNELSGPNKNKNYSRLALDVSSPMFNRAIKGQYPPGSTFKPLGALVALDEGLITPSYGYACGGTYYGCTRPLNCTEKWGGHANNLRDAIAWSCNSYFSEVLKKTIDNPKYRNPRKGLMVWKDYMTAMGLGYRLGVDLPSEDAGNIPDTADYDKSYNGLWNSCTMVGGGLGIGQDKMLTTPLQLANAMCVIANKGYYYTPHFVKKIDNYPGADSILAPYKVKHEALTHISDQAFEIVISGMQDVVDKGTGRVAQIPGIQICAKTGTAQNRIIFEGKRLDLKDNSMFVCFAPRDNPKIAIAVVVQNGGYGSTWAAPIASIIMEKYLNDTLRPEKARRMEEISQTNLMPSYLKRMQYREDSIRAFKWFEMTKDSAYIEKYLKPVRQTVRPAAVPTQQAAVPAKENKSNHSNQPKKAELVVDRIRTKEFNG
ncbi:penicillin-binding protein 2 [Gynurincola endophyticus]|uniref:penicillin-binding protein 2 n=1 Tax=Gynurincola endophyticus TaxID=2479004 RepID=UPI000F8D012C|nr:penicillin-binding protein 2 [Gynurincola endophyticus]